jgi:alpha-glucoside transport system permease protein
MYKLLFNFGSPERSSAVAVILLLAVIPVLIFNLRQFRTVEARR